MIKGLPLKVVDFKDEQDLYLAVLQVWLCVFISVSVCVCV